MTDDSPRLYLMLPAQPDPVALPGLLKAALEAGDVACLLVDHSGLAPGDVAKVIAACKPLCARYETALLVRDPELAGEPGVDGAHISSRGDDLEKLLDAAVKKLKPDSIVGAGGVRSRHEAMSAGERDIDYVMFGEPAADGYTPPQDQVVERTAWWVEIFNVPCVVYAPQLAMIAPLAAAKRDFLALREAVWADPRGPAAAVQEAMVILRKAAAISGVSAGASG